MILVNQTRCWPRISNCFCQLNSWIHFGNCLLQATLCFHWKFGSCALDSDELRKNPIRFLADQLISSILFVLVWIEYDLIYVFHDRSLFLEWLQTLSDEKTYGWIIGKEKPMNIKSLIDSLLFVPSINTLYPTSFLFSKQWQYKPIIPADV